MLNLTRDLLALRRAEPALSVGSWRPLKIEGETLAYAREAEGQRFLILANLDAAPKSIRVGEPVEGVLVLSTIDGAVERPIAASIDLQGDEALIIRVSG